MDETFENNLSETQQNGVEQKPQNEGEQQEKAAEKPAPNPYPVFGTDISIFEGDFIDFYKARMKIMAIKFKLVGQVNSQGAYVISEDIRRDLVRMEKEIEDSGETFYKAIALYMRKYFYFHVKIEPNDDGTAKATLFLSEFVDGFLGQDYIVTPVAEYTSINDDEYRIRVRKAFHLVDVEVKNDDTAVPDLAVIMQDALDMELLLGGFFDMAGQVYLMKMLKVLEESDNPICKRVLDRYHELLALQNLDINEKFKYIKFKSLLDNAIDEVGGLEKLGINFNILRPIIADYNKITKMITSARKGILEMSTAVAPDALKQAGNNSAQTKKTAGKQAKKVTKPAAAAKAPAKKPAVKPAASSSTKSNGLSSPWDGVILGQGKKQNEKYPDSKQRTPVNDKAKTDNNFAQASNNTEEKDNDKNLYDDFGKNTPVESSDGQQSDFGVSAEGDESLNQVSFQDLDSNLEMQIPFDEDGKSM